MESIQKELFNASREGNLETVCEILGKFKDSIHINQINHHYNMNSFMVACLGGHWEIVELFLKQSDINVNIKDTSYGETAFFLACSYGRDKVVEELIKDGRVDVTLSNKLNWSPLMAASYYGNAVCVQMILKSCPARAAVEQKSEKEGGFPVIPQGADARQIALQRKQLEIVDILDLHLSKQSQKRNSLKRNSESLLLSASDGLLSHVEELVSPNRKRSKKSQEYYTLYNICNFESFSCISKWQNLSRAL